MHCSLHMSSTLYNFREAYPLGYQSRFALVESANSIFEHHRSGMMFDN